MSTYKTAYTTACKQKLCHACTYNRHPEDEPSGSKHIENIVKNLNINVTKVHFVGLYYEIILQCTVQRTYKNEIEYLTIYEVGAGTKMSSCLRQTCKK